jgi:hypothetical protein
MVQVLNHSCSKIRFRHQRRDCFEFEEERWQLQRIEVMPCGQLVNI